MDARISGALTNELVVYRVRRKSTGEFLARRTCNYKSAKKTIWFRKGDAKKAWQCEPGHLVGDWSEWEVVPFKLVEVQ